VFDFFPNDDPANREPSCSDRLAALKRDTVFTVGKVRWRVSQNHGITSYVVKAGTKGKKLYLLRPTDTESLRKCCVEVVEVSGGSGKVLPGQPAAARGCLVAGTATTWERRRRKTRKRQRGGLG
jgi:hypothetical protein